MKSARWGDFGPDVRLVAAVPRTHEPPVSLSTTMQMSKPNECVTPFENNPPTRPKVFANTCF